MRCCPYVYIYIWSMGEVSGAILWRRGFLFGMAEGGNGTAGTCWRRKKSPLRGEPQRG